LIVLSEKKENTHREVFLSIKLRLMLASNLSLDEPTLISAVFDGTCPSIFDNCYLRIACCASNQFLPSLSPASCYLASSVTPPTHPLNLSQLAFTRTSNVKGVSLLLLGLLKPFSSF